jgi:hypothetical protein
MRKKEDAMSSQVYKAIEVRRGRVGMHETGRRIFGLSDRPRLGGT